MKTLINLMLVVGLILLIPACKAIPGQAQYKPRELVKSVVTVTNDLDTIARLTEPDQVVGLKEQKVINVKAKAASIEITQASQEAIAVMDTLSVDLLDAQSDVSKKFQGFLYIVSGLLLLAVLSSVAFAVLAKAYRSGIVLALTFGTMFGLSIAMSRYLDYIAFAGLLVVIGAIIFGLWQLYVNRKALTKIISGTHIPDEIVAADRVVRKIIAETKGK